MNPMTCRCSWNFCEALSKGFSVPLFSKFPSILISSDNVGMKGILIIISDNSSLFSFWFWPCNNGTYLTWRPSIYFGRLWNQTWICSWNHPVLSNESIGFLIKESAGAFDESLIACSTVVKFIIFSWDTSPRTLNLKLTPIWLPWWPESLEVILKASVKLFHTLLDKADTTGCSGFWDEFWNSQALLYIYKLCLSFVRNRVPKRSMSRRIHSKGMFEGCKVRRGPDWRWKDQDGRYLVLVQFNIYNDSSHI